MNGKRILYKKLLASDCICTEDLRTSKSASAPALSVVPFFSINFLEVDLEKNRLTTVATAVRNKAEAITKRVNISVEASL